MKSIKTIGSVQAIELANYILKHSGPMSHLKVQKLLFYCQAYHLVMFDGAPLFSEDFQAWVHGPVCATVFHSLKERSILFNDMKYDETVDIDPDPAIQSLTSGQKELIDEIIGQLKHWTDLELESATHRENPWRHARKGYDTAQKCTVVISKDSMRSYYSEELSDEGTKA